MDMTLLIMVSYNFDSHNSASCKGYCFLDSGYMLGVGT